jgi:hypothetical protein
MGAGWAGREGAGPARPRGEGKRKGQLGWALREKTERGYKRKREWAGLKEKKREKKKCI